MRQEASADEVYAAVRKYVAESDGMVENWRLRNAVADELGINRSQSSRLLRQTWAKFTGQVTRSLNALAAEGMVLKVGRGQRGPDGKVAYANEVRYFTSQAWQQAEREAEAREAERQHQLAVQQEITERFARCGYEVLVEGGGVTFKGDQAGRLLDELERRVMRDNRR
jgi:hypothetical protein